MVVDCFTYHNEADLLELRLGVLDHYVDEFVIVESSSTFAAFPKPFYFEENKERFAKWLPKIKYYKNNDTYTQEEIALAVSSPNTAGGSARWVHEFLQKEQIQKAISHLQDDDFVFIGDVDEIVEPKYYIKPPEVLTKYKLRVYTYFLNLRSDEQFWGTISARYRDIKGKCLNHLRNNETGKNSLEYSGWHFTSQGGIDAVRQKLNDQYNEEVFGPTNFHALPDRFGIVDYMGRDFKMSVDEKEWPDYLKQNRHKYEHLLK